jgi:flagellar motility protein MotE (MotC chaperone)
MKTQNAEHRIIFFISGLLFCVFYILSSASAQDDVVSMIEKKQKELKIKEEQIEKEDKKLNALKKDIEEKIEKYTKLLSELDIKLKQIEKIKAERLENIVKIYEGMSPEEAASKLAALDERTAIEIISGMKSKKAGAVLTYMDAKKVASITEGLAKIEKKFPTE